MERPALLIIDMVKDNFRQSENLPITQLGRQIIAPINDLIRVFRRQGWPIAFPTDAFHKEDFIFKGLMNPHSLAETEGAEVIDELDRRDEDLWLQKPRFSAFFNTTLEQWLREKRVTLCAVAGITTNFCVLTTVLDAICYGFKAILLEDCSAASSITIHKSTLSIYRRNPLYPLLQIASSSELLTYLRKNS